ncbi:hypothetical protein BaRGS_00032634, partial [Batillaria attramentaria]
MAIITWFLLAALLVKIGPSDATFGHYCWKKPRVYTYANYDGSPEYWRKTAVSLKRHCPHVNPSIWWSYSCQSRDKSQQGQFPLPSKSRQGQYVYFCQSHSKVSSHSRQSHDESLQTIKLHLQYVCRKYGLIYPQRLKNHIWKYCYYH